jgi:hypothetical protein
MQILFQYLKFKNFLMVYLRPNLDDVYYLHFVPKFQDSCGTIAPQVFFMIWECLGLTYLYFSQL